MESKKPGNVTEFVKTTAIVGGVAWIIDAEQHRGAPGPRKETTVWSPPGAAFGAGVSTSF